PIGAADPGLLGSSRLRYGFAVQLLFGDTGTSSEANSRPATGLVSATSRSSRTAGRTRSRVPGDGTRTSWGCHPDKAGIRRVSGRRRPAVRSPDRVIESNANSGAQWVGKRFAD